ncbi:outer envelope protein [Duganella hordei]|uniref:outer envelope protein n=1 Tax=Duganella hordei TaxID=2865934 RepID=UPI0030E82214
MKTRQIPQLLCIAFLSLAGSVNAADWSDTSVSWRYGTDYREPFNSQDIAKNIVALTHVSGYKYGTNFFNADFLMSDKNDPASLTQKSGANEAYILYRNTVDLSKVTGTEYKFGPVRGLGITGGFDVNTKNDVGYNSRKRMFVLGPTFMWDVPAGHFNTSLLLINESNAPSGAFPPISTVTGRYTYKTHAMLSSEWGIPFGSLWAFEGYANFIASKGKDEVGNDTGAETNIDMQVMFDVGAAMGHAKNTFRIGVEYQYWRNKFGNTSATTGGQGYVAKTPMIRAEYHF